MQILIPSLLTALLHLYLGWRLVPALALQWPWAGWIMAGTLVASMVLVPLPFLTSRGRSPSSPLTPWLGFLAMGFFSSLLMLTLSRDLLGLGLWFAGQPLHPWTFWSALASVVAAVLACAVGMLGARKTARVRSIDVVLPRLPDALLGFKIVQLSDLHVGNTVRRAYIERIVEKVNRLEADAIAITGDLVDGSVAELANHIAPLADLKSRCGVFVVTGNHDHYAGASAWVAHWRSMGLTVLLNEHVLLEPAQADKRFGRTDSGNALLLAGVTDFHAHHFDSAQASDPVRALAGAPASIGAKVLLAHQPRSAAAAAAAGFELQLSGHTHGGQFWPWNWMVPLQQPFVAGLHRVQQMWIYVSRGTGYWGPPKRLGAPSEITVIRLVRSD